MSDIDISNGTCYTAAGERLDGSFIPCGNTAFGYQTCCGAGDTCLADLACFGIHGTGYGSFLTYFAGCTDSSYSDASCPNKHIGNQPWVALTLCDNSDGAWAVCSQSGSPSTLQAGSYCSCTNSASATIAFKDATVLANYAVLPQRTGESISFFAGHTPTGSPTAVTTTAVASGTSGGGSTEGGSSGSTAASGTAGTRTTATPSSGSAGSTSRSGTSSAASSAAASSSTSSSSNGGSAGSSSNDPSSSGGKSGLGTGALVGIIIGAIVGVLILAALAFLLFRRRRRRSTITAEKDLRDSKLGASPMRPGGLGEYVEPAMPSMPEVEGAPVSEVAGRPAKPWALRSELDGKEVPKGGRSGLGNSAKPAGSSSPYELP